MDDCANTQYPPITGKLRELVADVNWHEITDNIGGPWLDSWHRAMRDRCDTIDAIHARLEAAYDRLRAERDSMAAALDRAEGEHEYAPESHYVMLPKDADGEPVHIGDVMEWPDGETFEVVGIGDGVLFYTYDDDYAEWTGASTKRHHHTPTVEDLLREFADEMNQNLGMYTGEAIDADEWRSADAKTVEKFAAKLRLAGDSE